MNCRLGTTEQQLLLLIWRAARDGSPPDRAAIDRLARERLDIAPDWDWALPRLLQEELIRQEGDGYALTEQGQASRERAAQAYPLVAYTYDAYFSRAASSRAHAQFCEQVDGRNLCQHGLADMDQVDKLVEVLDVREGQRLLDLGCGNGMIAEYISDVTGAHVTGIDVSLVGIRQALERTQDKRHRLAFEAGNLKRVKLPQGAFDAILFIDTIYFLDQEPALRHAQAALRPGGQMGLLYTQWLKDGDTKEALQPESTELAEHLRCCGLHFETWDYSAAEDAHWQKKLDVLAALKPAFEAEGSMWLHAFRWREAAHEPIVRAWETRSRHLYRAW